jgi:hypothetical protein
VSPVPKGDTGKFRPVVVVESIFRVVGASVAMQIHDRADKILMPFQTALHSSATFSLALGINYALKGDPEMVGVGFDMSNAYSSLSRESVVDGLEETGLSFLLPLFLQSYGRPNLCCMVQGGESRAVEVKTGIFAGDGMSPLWFSVALVGVLKKASAEMDTNQAVLESYLDDTLGFGRIEELLKATPVFIREARRIGLTINTSKTVIFGYEEGEVERAKKRMQELLGVEKVKAVVMSHNHHTILGSPMGRGMSVARSLAEKWEEEREQIMLIKRVSRQCGLLLLRQAILPRIMHLLRCVPPEWVMDYAKAFDEAVMEVCQSLHGDHRLDGLGRQQVRLRVRRGGLGLTSAEEVAPCAYLGSHADLLAGAREFFPAFQERIEKHLEGETESGASLRRAMVYVRDLAAQAGAGKTTPDVKLVTPGSVGELKALGSKAQRKITEALHQKKEKEYEGRADAARRNNLLSLQQTGAAAVVLTIPQSPELEMEDEEFAWMLGRRNMAEMASPVNGERRCACGEAFSRERDGVVRHLESNCAWAKELSIHRHNDVVKELAQIIKERGLQVVVEQKLVHTSGQRGDLFIPALTDRRGRGCVVDVSIADHIGTEGSALKKKLAAANQRAQAKHAKYDKVLGQQYYLVAAVMEKSGALNNEFATLLKRVAREGNQEPDDLYAIGRQVAVVMQRSNAALSLELHDAVARGQKNSH